ncbi:MAG: MaoC/PaaZ C-terminal domain-containing protein [Deltaproteobacteria bacterium]|nr:MaoC/PaaZ C-terminal domain-containing protein [Deltaproteobacteria bacterium]
MPYKMRGLTFDEFEVGQAFDTMSRTITEADVVAFAGVSGDFNPLHTDEQFMKSSPFGGRIAHGMLCASIGTGLANQLGIFEGTTIAVMQITLKFTGAVRFGDTVRLKLTCKDKKESSKGDKGTATFSGELFNQKDERVLDSEWVVLLRKGR